MNNDMMKMMPGLPPELFWTALTASAFLAIATLLLPQDSKPSLRLIRGWRFNLLTIPLIGKFARSRKFQFTLQFLPVVLLFVIIATGLFGIQSSLNLAPVLTWTIWWALLIFDIVLIGRSWCLICPWYAIASWLRRLAFWRRTNEPISLNRPWPKSLKNLYLAIGLFLTLTWLELGFNVTSNPQVTALLALLMTTLVVIPALVYDRMAFCHYGCLIGRICGLYSLVAPVEIRPTDRNICKSCATRDCRTGSDSGYPCPTDLDLGTLQKNTYCLNCSECIKSCPHDNVAYNIRPFASDLREMTDVRKDEALLAVVLLAMTSFHGLTMTPAWDHFLEMAKGMAGVSYLTAFSLGMLVLLACFIISFRAVGYIITAIEPRPKASFRSHDHFAYCLIPLALFYHLAHNGAHFIKEASALLIALSDPFDWGWDLFGYAQMKVMPLLPAKFTFGLQTGLILIGFLLSLRICRTTLRLRYPKRKQQLLPGLVVVAALLGYQLFNLWLLYQPMSMRSGL